MNAIEIYRKPCCNVDESVQHMEKTRKAIFALLNHYSKELFSVDDDQGCFNDGRRYYIYETKNQGAVVIDKHNRTYNYIAKVYLIGFNPNNKIFKELKSKLEKLANAEDANVAKRILSKLAD